MSKKLYNKLKEYPVILNILLISEGWLVGGSIASLLDNKEPKDFDIIVPDRELFMKVCKHLEDKGDITFNTLGGIKCTNKDLTIDIWCNNLEQFILNANKVDYLYNLKKNKTILAQ